MPADEPVKFLDLFGKSSDRHVKNVRTPNAHANDDRRATARKIASLPQVVELNIGHFLIGEAIFVGLANAIARMRAAMDEGRRAAG